MLGGGRYDGLIENIGGPATPAVGWAAGIERLAMLVDEPETTKPDAVIIPLGAAAEEAAGGILADLRRAGFGCEMAFKGNMKKRMQKANDSGARYAIIVGDNELLRGDVAVKDLVDGSQQDVELQRLTAFLGN